MTDTSDYNLRFQIELSTLDALTEKSKQLFPSLEPDKALQITFISILHSIQMDFHPQDLLFPAISGSNEVDFQAILLKVNKITADSFAKYFAENSLTSFASLRIEIRKRILEVYESLQQYSEQASF